MECWNTTAAPIRRSSCAGAALRLETLKAHLRENLAEDMVPQAFVALGSIPVGQNGKVDREALPPVDWNVALAAPVTDQAEVGPTQDAKQTAPQIVIETLDRAHPMPLSPAQKRLWLLHRLDPSSGAYHLPLRIEMTGPLDLERVRSALAALVVHHEALRSTIQEVDGGPVVTVSPSGALPLDVVDLRENDSRDAILLKEADARVIAAFDLNTGPLVRATVFRMSEAETALLICAHQIVADDTSMGILAQDFATAYDGAALPSNDLQYADFAAHVLGLQAEADDEPLFAYWRKSLADLPPHMTLPTDHERPDKLSGASKLYSFHLSSEEAEAVHAGAIRMGVTPFALMQSVFGLMLARLSGQGAFAMGAVTEGRDLPGSDTVIGRFAETLALRRADFPNDVHHEPGPSARVLCRRASA